MNAILVKLNVALQEAESLIESLKKEKRDVELSHSLLNKGLEDLKIKNDEFSQREAAITPIENFNKVKASNDAKAAELKSESDSLSDKKKAFESYKSSEIERINNLRLLAEKENDNVVQAYKNLEAEVDKRVKEFVSKHLK